MDGDGIIGTARLELVPLAEAHAEEMAGVLADPALHAFTGGSPYPVQELRARYARLVAGSPDPAQTWLNWVVRLRADGRLAGTVQATLTAEPDGPDGTPLRRAEVAWVIGSPWQGRGIATEAARALTDRLREQGVAEIRAHVHPDHHASAAVARAAGLSPTAHRQDGEIRWAWTAAG